MAVVDGDILRGTGKFTLGRGSAMQSVLHFKYTGAGDTDDEIGDEISGHFTSMYTNVEDSLDSLTLSEEVDVWRWDAVLDQWDGIYSEPWLLIIGTEAGQQLPNGAAALVRLFSSLPRRQGRKFISGVSTNMYLDAGWTALFLADLALFLADTVASVATANGTLQPGLFNVVDEDFIPFKNAGGVNVFAAYQRRRRPGVGI